VTDRQTDGWTELRWLRRAESSAAFARKKTLSSATFRLTRTHYQHG